MQVHAQQCPIEVGIGVRFAGEDIFRSGQECLRCQAGLREQCESARSQVKNLEEKLTQHIAPGMPRTNEGPFCVRLALLSGYYEDSRKAHNNSCKSRQKACLKACQATQKQIKESLIATVRCVQHERITPKEKLALRRVKDRLVQLRKDVEKETARVSEQQKIALNEALNQQLKGAEHDCYEAAKVSLRQRQAPSQPASSVKSRPRARTAGPQERKKNLAAPTANRLSEERKVRLPSSDPALGNDGITDALGLSLWQKVSKRYQRIQDLGLFLSTADE